MKKIKFRAWSNSLKSFVFYKDGVDVSVSLDKNMAMTLEDDNIEFMMFSGLKDKNGKEIYEGDIVKKVYQIDVTALGEKGHKLETHKIKGYVKFEKGHFGIYFIEHTNEYAENTFYPFLNSNEYEIVGNIYENKELLEVDND